MNQIYKNRRQQLIQNICKDYNSGIIVIPTAPSQIRNNDVEFPYRFDSNFYYLTGFSEPEAFLIIIFHENGDSKHILICRDKDSEREIWDGYRHGIVEARQKFEFDESYCVKNWQSTLQQLAKNQSRIFYPIGLMKSLDNLVISLKPKQIINTSDYLREMRLLKDKHEIRLMKTAGQITSGAHEAGMIACQPDMYEYELQAEIEYYLHRSGCGHLPAYGSIVAGGKNATVLHYVENNQILQSGDLVLIDAGGEYMGYASDITRTYPVNGTFSSAQKDIYQLVLSTQKEAFKAVKIGTTIQQIHQASLRVLVQGLIDLGLCKGSIDNVIDKEEYKKFYMHGIGHFLGLDVHDVGDRSIPLQEGMVFTIEPGCYIRPSDDVPEAFWNIGVRIEDNILINSSGFDNLTQEAPKEINALEEIIKKQINLDA